MNLILYENDMYELQEIQYLKNCSSDRKKRNREIYKSDSNIILYEIMNLNSL